MRFSFGLSLCLLACAYALWRGGREEHRGAQILLALWLVPSVFTALGATSMGARVFNTALLDYAVMAICLSLALRSQRRWVLWFTAAQLVAVIGHVLLAFLPHMPLTAYSVLTGGVGYLQCIVLLFGTMANKPPRHTIQP